MSEYSLQNKLREFLGCKNFENKSTGESLDFLAQLVDLSWDLGRADGARHAQDLAEQLLKTEISDSEQAELYYFIGNSWAALRDAEKPESRKSFDWEIAEVEKELIYLRKSAHHTGFDKLPLGRRCQVLTNLAGRLSEIGRPVEALYYWDLSLKEAPSFGMAHGNRGVGVWKYGHHLYDQGHFALFLHEAEAALKKSCSSKSTDPGALDYFMGELARIPKVKPSSRQKKEYSLGNSEEEIAYRQWCLQHRLFLNPLNDIRTDSIAATDVFALPSIVTKNPEMPLYFSRFNLLKQEYITARHILYLGQESDEPHYADRDVPLVNTLDYQLYSIRIEYLKLAYRSAYSVLDKIAFFINDYFNLRLEETRIYFRSIWYKDGKKQLGLAPIFLQSKNWPLRGLFWLSKDIFENKPEFREAISPDAQRLHEVRNHLEHKYVTLHDSILRFDGNDSRPKDGIVSLSIEDFYHKTMRLMSLSRSALLYLSMAVYVEEERKREAEEGAKITASIPLTNVDHSWKRTWRK